MRQSAVGRIALYLLVAGLASGCSGLRQSITATSVPLQELKTSATYDIIGPATGTSTGGYLLGAFPIGVERKYGVVVGSSFARIVSPVVRAAIYNAINSVPGADALLAPRVQITHRNYLVWRRETVTITAKAVRFNVSAE